MAESLEHEQIVLDVVHIAAVAFDAGIYFFEKVIFHPVDVHQHGAATFPLADAQLVVYCGDMQRLFKDAQVR